MRECTSNGSLPLLSLEGVMMDGNTASTGQGSSGLGVFDSVGMVQVGCWVVARAGLFGCSDVWCTWITKSTHLAVGMASRPTIPLHYLCHKCVGRKAATLLSTNTPRPHLWPRTATCGSLQLWPNTTLSKPHAAKAHAMQGASCMRTRCRTMLN